MRLARSDERYETSISNPSCLYFLVCRFSVLVPRVAGQFQIVVQPHPRGPSHLHGVDDRNRMESRHFGPSDRCRPFRLDLFRRLVEPCLESDHKPHPVIGPPRLQRQRLHQQVRMQINLGQGPRRHLHPLTIHIPPLASPRAKKAAGSESRRDRPTTDRRPPSVRCFAIR